MTLVIQVLIASALVWLNVAIVTHVWCALLDYRAERRASDLMPHLAAAHKELRRFRPELARLKRIAARLQRALWGRETN